MVAGTGARAEGAFQVVVPEVTGEGQGQPRGSPGQFQGHQPGTGFPRKLEMLVCPFTACDAGAPRCPREQLHSAKGLH